MTRVTEVVKTKAVEPSVIEQSPVKVWPLERIKDSAALRAAVPVDAQARRALSEKIRRDGRVDTPLDVTADGVVVDGYGRLDGARAASLANVPVTIHEEWAGRSEPELISESISRNVETRRHLTQAQWVQLGRTIEKVEIELARERKNRGQIEGGRSRARKKSKKDEKSQLGGNVPPKHARQRALDLVARRVGMDRRTYEKGKKVLELHDGGKTPLARLYLDDLVSAGLTLRALESTPSPQKQHAILRRVEQLGGQDPALRRRVARTELRRLVPIKEKKKKRPEVAGVVRRLSALSVDIAVLIDIGLETEGRQSLLGELEAVVEQLAELRSAIEAAE